MRISWYVPGTDLTAYRIIREALGNPTKHASGRTARVRLSCSGSCLTVTVTNDGTAAMPVVPGCGRGLTGMRERVPSAGGKLCAVPPTEGGSEVTTTPQIQSRTRL